LIEDFEELEFVIISLGDYIDRLKQENDSLRDKEAYFTSTIKDRDQEIEQLQLHLQKETAIGNNKPDVVFDKKMEGLIGRVRSMALKKNSQN
jgi:hypothetical protein